MKVNGYVHTSPALFKEQEPDVRVLDKALGSRAGPGNCRREELLPLPGNKL
jgi:hypothetical protein